MEFFNIQTSFNTNSIFLRKYENSSIHRLENQITFSKQYVLTIRLYIKRFLLLKNCNYFEYRSCWKVLFQNLDKMLYSNHRVFLSFFSSPLNRSQYQYTCIAKLYFHDNYVLRIQHFCMYEFYVVHILFIFVYWLCVSPNNKECIINHYIDALHDCGLLLNLFFTIR